MTFSRRTFLSLAGSAGTLSAFSGSAEAQVYPGRPITLIVPLAAGGPTDTIAGDAMEQVGPALSD
jgi:tripartite-type tricarboxylate transporter receptor subunit TctC